MGFFRHAEGNRPAEGGIDPILILVAAGGIGFFFLPMIGLAGRIHWSDFPAHLKDPYVLRALWISVLTSLTSVVLALLFGAPIAWLLARKKFPGRNILRVLVTLPMVMPPVVAGVALLAAFGRRGVFGPALAAVGIELPFTTTAAVLAQTFVAAPFLILTLEAALRSMDPGYEDVASTLGASRGRILLTVTMPMVRPSLVAGLSLAWARALGEFGATITFAGNFEGVTQTMPLAVYMALEQNPDVAFLLSFVLLLFSFVMLISLRRPPSVFTPGGRA